MTLRWITDARVRPGIVVVAAALAAVLALAPPAGARRARPDKILSNETTHTTWTIADVAGDIRTQPNSKARVITKLGFSTPDGFEQTYILLREHWTGSTAWIRLRIPGRPNGRTGWVLRRDLDQFEVSHMEIVVNRAARELTLYRDGKVIYRAPVGVGKPSTPTPAGHFWITEAFPSSDAFYGPYAFGTSDYSTLSEWPGGGIVGLHGTNTPQLIPGDPSHGCIRLRNSDIVALEHLISIGTPLWVK